MTKHLTERELATRWRWSLRSQQRMRASGDGPPFLRMGRSILYRLEDVEAYESTLRDDGSMKL